MIIQGRTFPVKQIIVLATSPPRPVELTQEFFDKISHYYETRKSRNWTSSSLNKFRIKEKKSSLTEKNQVAVTWLLCRSVFTTR